MLCETVRKGVDCVFMKKNGCSYIGGICREIIEKCEGCARKIQYESGWYCSSSPDPNSKWRATDCNIATHITREATETTAKINPLKASKRAQR